VQQLLLQQLTFRPTNLIAVIVIHVFATSLNLSARTLVTFYVVSVVDNKRQVRSGVDVVSTLAKKLRSSTDAFDFRVLKLHTVGAFSIFYTFYKAQNPVLAAVELSVCLSVHLTRWH